MARKYIDKNKILMGGYYPMTLMAKGELYLAALEEVEQGNYSSISHYMRTLIERDHEFKSRLRNAKLLHDHIEGEVNIPHNEIRSATDEELEFRDGLAAKHPDWTRDRVIYEVDCIMKRVPSDWERVVREREMRTRAMERGDKQENGSNGVKSDKYNADENALDFL